MGGTAFLHLPSPHERVPYRALLACNHDGWLGRRTVAPAQPDYVKSDRQVIAAGAINIHLDQDVLRASVLHQPSLLHQLYDPMVALTLAALTTMATLAALFALYAMGTLGGASPLTQSYTGLTAHEFSDPYNRSVAFGSHGRRADLTHLTRTLLLAACTLGPLLLVALLHVIVRAAPAREETVVRGSLTGGWSVLSRLLEKNDLTFRACPASGLLVWASAPAAVALRKEAHVKRCLHELNHSQNITSRLITNLMTLLQDTVTTESDSSGIISRLAATYLSSIFVVPILPWLMGGYGTVQSTLVMMCSDGFITVQRVRVAGNQWRTITYATPLEARRQTLQTYRPAMFLREVPEAAETEGKLPPVAEEEEVVVAESETSVPSTAVQTTKAGGELQPGSVELCCLCLFPCTGDADGDSDMMTTCCMPSGRPSEPEAPQVTAEEKELQAATAAMVKDTRFPLVSRLMSQLLLTPPLELHYVQRNQEFGNPYTNPASAQKRASVAVILRLAPTAAARPSTGNEGVEVLMLQTWSGNVCLPGGHVQGTETLAETAIRKTREETKLDLQRQRAHLIGRLNDRKPSGSHDLVVSVFVFALPVTDSDPPIHMQGDDIAGYRWVPLSTFMPGMDEAAEITQQMLISQWVESSWLSAIIRAVGAGRVAFPAIQLPIPDRPKATLSRLGPSTTELMGDPQDREHLFVLWGATLGTIADLLAAAKLPACRNAGGLERRERFDPITRRMHLTIGFATLPAPRAVNVFMIPAVMVVLYLRDLGVPAGVAFVAGISANLLLPVLPVLAALVVAARAML